MGDHLVINQNVQATLNEYFREAGYQLKDILKRNERGSTYLFSVDDTTCVLKLYEQYLALELGVGVVTQAKAQEVLADACARLYFCNFPFAVGIPPFDDKRLLVLRFRMEASMFKAEFVLELLEVGFMIAADMRNEFVLRSVVQAQAN